MKIGIYTRVSTEEQAVHGVSLIAQENALMEYAKKHDYKVVDVYSDEGLSATTLDRPGLQRLLEDVRQGIRLVPYWNANLKLFKKFVILFILLD